MDMRSRTALAILGCTALMLGSTPHPATAQIRGPHITLSPYAGGINWDNKVNVNGGIVYGGRLGLMLNEYFGVEGAYDHAGSTSIHGGTPWNVAGSTEGSTDLSVSRVSACLILQIAPHSKASPYLVGGWSRVEFKPTVVGIGEEKDAGFTIGAGALVRLAPRLNLRFDGRDFGFRFHADNPFGTSINHNIEYTGGLQLSLGGHKWTGTPVVVEAPEPAPTVDSDGDNVPDGTDQCPNTPHGCTVDARGCPVDTDNDGVCDGVDQCANTPAGTQVDANGCPLNTDSDGDGVPDSQDKCPNTPTGCKADATGCPIDADGDGVCDGLDQCPNTPANARVDKDGCPIEVNEMEKEILSTGKIVLHNVNFDFNKATIKAESEPTLNEVGQTLIQWPDLKIEIGGHTDSKGTDAYNQSLSERRANAVLSDLTSHFPQIQASQWTAVGYGESKPVAKNTTAAGRALNRRVEFKVLNNEALEKVRERRHILYKGK